MNATHTPGPWSADLVCNKVRANDGEIEICRTYSDVNIAEENANARLIAAAPELLEWLQWCLNEMDKHELPLSTKPHRNRARAAIEKATGKQ